MSLPETLIIAAVAALVLAVVLGLILRATLTPRPDPAATLLAAELDTLRQTHAITDRDLAVARSHTARLAELDASLQAATAKTALLMDQRAAAENLLSTREAELAAAAAATTDLRQRLQAAETRAAAASAENAAHAATLAKLQESLDQERNSAKEKLALLQGARDDMANHFKVLAEDVMTRHGADFTKLNKDQVEALLAPLKEKLGEFQARIEATHLRDTQDRATLGEQLRNIVDTSDVMKRKTEDLTDALRGRAQAQGAWGEMVLATVLEHSGLRAGHEYIVQASITDEEGRRFRPDVLINLPDNQRLVIDSKVSLTAFERVVAAGSDEDRAAHLKAHLASLRSHIAGLGSKEYHRLSGSSLTFVVMFVPIEGALAAALRAEPDLAAYAVRSNVMLTTPTTLLMALRTVASVWQAERRNLNAEDIANRAGALYDKFVGFVEDLGAVGGHLTRSQAALDGAMKKLHSGNGNLVRQAEMLRKLGAGGSKKLPAPLVEAAEATLTVTAEITHTELTAELRIPNAADAAE